MTSDAITQSTSKRSSLVTIVAAILVDTGPFVAWIVRREPAHAEVREFIDTFDGELITTWPVLTEACHLLPQYAVVRFMQWIAGGGAQVHDMRAAAGEISALMDRYSDLPMDLADASLVWLAGATGVTDVLTLDETDFGIYRLPDGKRFRNALRR